MPVIPFEILAIIKLLILPPGLQFLLLIFAALLYRRKRAVAIFFISVALLSLYLLSLPVVSQRLASMVEIYPPVDLSTQAAKQAEAIVILGSGPVIESPEYEAEISSARQLQRLQYGAYLHDKTGLPMLLSGGRVLQDVPSEAEIMQRTLQQFFQLEALWLETESINTRENAIRSFARLRESHISRVMLVTHASHMPRAVIHFEQAGFSVVPAPTLFTSGREETTGLRDCLPAAHALQTSTVILHEVVGLLALRLGI